MRHFLLNVLAQIVAGIVAAVAVHLLLNLK